VTEEVAEALASNARLRCLVLLNCIFNEQAAAKLSRLNKLEVLVLSRARVKGNKQEWLKFCEGLRNLLKSQQNLRTLSLRNVTFPYGWLRDGLLNSPSISTLEALDLVGHDNLDDRDQVLFAKMTKLQAISLDIETAHRISDRAATLERIELLARRTLERTGRSEPHLAEPSSDRTRGRSAH
jgi:hypothetical protein